jgi:hypothetical protein
MTCELSAIEYRQGHRSTFHLGPACGCEPGNHAPPCRVGQPVDIAACYACSSVGVEVLRDQSERGRLCRCARAFGDPHLPKVAS